MIEICRDSIEIGEELGCQDGVDMVILDVNNHSKSHRHTEDGAERVSMKRLGTSQIWIGLSYLNEGAHFCVFHHIFVFFITFLCFFHCVNQVEVC